MTLEEVWCQLENEEQAKVWRATCQHRMGNLITKLQNKVCVDVEEFPDSLLRQPGADSFKW